MKNTGDRWYGFFTQDFPSKILWTISSFFWDMKGICMIFNHCDTLMYENLHQFLSGNTVWPHNSDVQKLVKIDHFGSF